MTNKDISKQLKLLGQLLELHGENPFKTKSYANASFQISKYSKPLIEASELEISAIPGIGKGLAQKIIKGLQEGYIEGLEDYLVATPAGILEMLDLKGLGASKIKVLWHQHGIDSVYKLLNACEQNQLVLFKGFGQSSQDNIKEAILFKQSNAGKLIFAEAHALASVIAQKIQELHPQQNAVHLAGAIYAKDIIVHELLFLVIHTSNEAQIQSYFNQIKVPIPMVLRFVAQEELPYHLLQTSAQEAHLTKLNLELSDLTLNEQQIYTKRGLPYIIPEMRNGMHEFKWTKQYHSSQIIQWEHLKGALHNHSKYSDGANTLKEMAYAAEHLGLQYFGIADHSKTAIYANGLSVERLQKQWDEIDAINAQNPSFTILKGIESDILHNGSLDYPDEILQMFDYVVASVHNGLSMDIQKATSRLIKAIEHPSTSILGHLSGRLLLRRPPYPLHYDKIIDACIANNVAIEINANPWRLDMDWTYIYQAMEAGAYFAINPDAHHTEGLKDMQYGVYAAQKAGLITERVINSFSLPELRKFLDK